MNNEVVRDSFLLVLIYLTNSLNREISFIAYLWLVNRSKVPDDDEKLKLPIFARAMKSDAKILPFRYCLLVSLYTLTICIRRLMVRSVATLRVIKSFYQMVSTKLWLKSRYRITYASLSEVTNFQIYEEQAFRFHLSLTKVFGVRRNTIKSDGHDSSSMILLHSYY